MDTDKKINILLIEDNPGDARLVSELLKDIRRFNYHLAICDTLESGLASLRHERAGVILLDLNLPDSSGKDTFVKLHAAFPDIPVILVSGLGDEELSLKLIQEGAQDYIHKGEADPRIFEKSVLYAFERHKLRTSLLAEIENRKIAEQEIQKQYSILDAIINNSHAVIIFLIDREYRYLGFNENHRKEMKKIYGADIEKGMNLLDMITLPEAREKAKITIDKVLRGETFIETQIQPGFNIYYEFHWNTVRKDGNIIGVSCFILDVTDRIAAQCALKESEEKYRTLVETAMSGIYISNLKGELLFANDAMCRMLGYGSAEEINKLGIGSMYQNQDDRRLFLEHLQKEKRVSNYELSLVTKTGRYKTGLFSAFLEGDRITGTLIDITELVEARERAEQSDRLKTAFMNNISHEIRTPLNSILGFSDLIRQPGLTAGDMRNFYEIISTSSQRLLSTITNYMDISMIATGNMEVQNKLFDPAWMMEELKDQFQTSCLLKNLHLHLKIPGKSQKLQLLSDAGLLRKALSHLLDNAVKFTREGEITFGYVIKSGLLEFFVKDTGTGIGKEAQSMIFENFNQEEISVTRSYEGSGLGLSIARGLIRLLGSDIQVKSEKGKGSLFSFQIPFMEQADVMATIEIPSLKAPEKSENPVILIAEDEESNLMYLETILGKAGFAVIPVYNGKMAVDFCHDHPEISLVLMDMKMPVMDGLEATLEIKSFRRELPVIAVTAFAMSGDEKRAREAGCDDYISKPLSKALLLNVISDYLDTI